MYTVLLYRLIYYRDKTDVLILSSCTKDDI